MKRILRVLAFLLCTHTLYGQCPQVYDFYLAPTTTPVWFHCQNSDYTLNLQSPNTINNYTIDWGDGSPVETGGPWVTPSIISHTYALTVDTYTILITDNDSGCTTTGTLTMEEATSASIQIPVGGLTQACAPQAMEFINSSTNTSPNTIFVWDFGDGSPNLTFDYTNLGDTITHTYQPGTVDCETTVTLTAENTCNTIQGGESTATFNPIRIWDIDDAAITPSDYVLCWPENTVTYTNTTELNCYFQGNTMQRYEYWNFGDYWGLGYDSIIDWTPWPPTFPHTFSYPGIGTYTTTLLDSNFCGIDAVTITIEIVAPPTAGITASEDTICAGESITFFNNSSSEANAYQINLDDGSGWLPSGGGSFSYTFNNPGSYNIGLIAMVSGASTACQDTSWVPIEVLPGPIADIGLTPNAGCETLDVNFTDNSTGADQWNWTFGNGNTSNLEDPGIQNYPSPGTYNVVLTTTANNGCQDTDFETVTVHFDPIANFTTSNVCLGQTATFVDLSTYSPGDTIVSWDWDFGDATTSNLQNPTHSYLTSGTYNVTLDITTVNCFSTVTIPIDVEPVPDAQFTVDVTMGCSPLEVTMTNNSIGGNSFLWIYGDGAISPDTNTVHTYINPSLNDTIFNVQLVASTGFGCNDTATIPVTVFHNPIAAFTHDAVLGCAPVDVNFTNSSLAADNYSWDFGDGNLSGLDNPSHQYANSGDLVEIYDVELVANTINGCTDTTYQSITVYPTPDYDISLAQDSGCAPYTVTFPNVIGAISYEWEFGDGQSGLGPTPTHTYDNVTNNDMVYTAQLIAQNAFGCYDTAYHDIVVHPTPEAYFILDNATGCSPFEVTITESSLLADSYQWIYGDGTTSDTTLAVHQHTYVSTSTIPVDYNLTLVVASNNGCQAQFTEVVTVNPPITAAFVSDTAMCSPALFNFINQTTGAISYLWDFDDGILSGATNPFHQYVNNSGTDDNYTVELVANNIYGCTDTVSQDITVFSQPIAGVDITTIEPCYPLEVSFENTSQFATSFEWTYGDGNVSDTLDITHGYTYTNSTQSLLTYDIELIANTDNGCSDTTSTFVQVIPPLEAEFEPIDPDCHPLGVFMENESMGALTYSWNFGDGVLSVLENPTHTFTNSGTTDMTYTVTLIAESYFGCADTTQQDVVVYATPFADFTVTPLVQTFPNSVVDIANNSIHGAATYEWEVSDGFISNDQNFDNYDFGTWGEFTIDLRIDNGFCNDQTSRTIQIIAPPPIANFNGSGDGCAPVTVDFENLSEYGETYLWSFGDGATASNPSPSYTYFTPGVYSVSLITTGPGGTDLVVHEEIVNVYPSATAYFTVNPESVTLGAPVFFFNQSVNATIFEWDFGDGASSSEHSPIYNYDSPGTYPVTLISNNEYNCPDTMQLSEAVLVEVGGQIEFPNAFTPDPLGSNGGIYDSSVLDNNVFFPVNYGVEEYKLQIYNRWGELIFETENVSQGWDGYYRGEMAQQDVYVWKVTATFVDGTQYVDAGDVTLLR